MIRLRSLIYNVVFYVNLVLFLVLGSPFYLTPRKWSIRALQAWASTSLWWLRIICGTRYEVRGRENIPEGAVLVAAKHQSAWDTFALLTLFDDPAMVLKRELVFIPLFGWFIPKFRMIPVERSSGAAALKAMVARAKDAAAMGRQIVIFPEGTRRLPDSAARIQAGCGGSLSSAWPRLPARRAQLRSLLAAAQVSALSGHDRGRDSAADRSGAQTARICRTARKRHRDGDGEAGERRAQCCPTFVRLKVRDRFG